MSLLNQVKRGKIRQPVLALIFGVDGVGKSTFAAEAPEVIFLGTEKGSANLDVARYPTPKSFKDVLAAIDDLRRNQHSFKTLAIDSLDWMEHLVFEQVCIDNNWKSIEDPGFGKGYIIAMNYWREMQSKLSLLRDERGMNIIIIAHSLIKTAKDPQAQAEYDRYQLKLNDKAAALWREFVDFVLFANFETFVKTEKSGKTKAFGEGDRYLYTERRPGFDAKSRMRLPHQIQMPPGESWAAFKQALDEAYLGDQNPERILDQINELLQEVKDPELKSKVEEAVKKAPHDVSRLDSIRNRLIDITTAA